ncbi:MAG: dihydroneopterin aldolase [Planctomycetota bacterium]
MPISSTIELHNLHLHTDIGTYDVDDVVPDAHKLDLILTIDSNLVLIEKDDMDCVFDYDPLIKEILQLAGDGHYETQERLMTLILQRCAAYAEIQAVEMLLRKAPVIDNSGGLGVRLVVRPDDMNEIRKKYIR